MPGLEAESTRIASRIAQKLGEQKTKLAGFDALVRDGEARLAPKFREPNRLRAEAPQRARWRRSARLSARARKSSVAFNGLGTCAQAYNAQLAVDAEAEVIVAAEVTQEVTDRHQQLPVIEQERLATEESPACVTADAGYWRTADAIKAQLAGLSVLVPPNSGQERSTMPQKLSQIGNPGRNEMVKSNEHNPEVVGRRRLILPFAIALLGLAINIIVATSMAPTGDERDHVSYGAQILRGKPDRFTSSFDSKMPVSALNAFPRGVGKFLRDHGMAPGLADTLQDDRAPRYATIAAAFGLCLLVFIYAESLFGRTAGLFAELIFVMDPNIIAHSTLSTTDLYVAAAAVLFLYCLHRFLLSPNTKNAVLTAFTLALAQLTKFTAAYLYIVLAMALVASALYARYGREKRYRIPRRQMAILLVLTVVCFLAVINAGFVFDRSFTRLAQYEFRSHMFRTLQQVPVLRAVPLPLPYAYVQGFDWMKYNNATGSGFGNIVLLNEVRGPQLARWDGFPSYFMIAYLLKEPIGLQLMLMLGLVWVFRNRSPADLLAGEGLLLAAASVFFVMLSFFSKTQIGIRHILPVLVIFAILSGGAFQAWAKFSSARKLLLVGCLLYVAVSVGSYYPHMIPYFNEILTDRKMAYRFLADSNLDWGQDAWVVDRFLKNNPDVILNPEHPVTGRILISANFMAGVKPAKADYFLRLEGMKPVAQVGYAHLLFLVPARQ